MVSTAFLRAMRQRVRRDGAHLYPAFPYDHFNHAADADIADLYAYLMTRRAVSASTPPNKLIPPVGFRPIIGLWKALFFRPRPFVPNPAHDAAWNRDAYLVDSLGHCGGCRRFPSPYRCRREAATATPSPSTTCPGRGWSTISCQALRYACQRCAPWART